MRHYLFLPFTILLILMAAPGLRGQTDSLLSVVAHTENDTSGLNALYELAKATLREDMPKAKAYALTMGHLADSRQLPVW